MVSMKDVSIACGVSIATVSKALNGQKDVSAVTRENILRVAKKMGYFPNSAARALKTNHSSNIGVLFVDESRSGLTHDYFANVLDSLKRTAEERGYDITFINTSKTRENRMSYLEHCRYRGFDGVIIACVDFYAPEVHELATSDIPVVTVDFVFDGVSAITSDNVKGISDLVHYVYNKGHRRIAYIHGSDSDVTRRRISSFKKVTEELGLSIPEEYFREAAYRDTTIARKETEKLLDLPNPPTCIFYPDDFAAFGGMRAIQERELRIPEDISVVGYDGIRLARHIKPKLTTLRQDTELLGQLAAQRLIDMIEDVEVETDVPVVVRGSVFEGNSVADLKE